MRESGLYCIGKVGEICKLSRKALRYYDKMGILSPDKVSDESGYRYYSKKTLLSVPMIKYYKQSGFKLEEMKSLLEGTTYSVFEKCFRSKIGELEDRENEINLKLKSIKDWYELIVEAQMVIENDVKEVSVKYLDNSRMVYLNQDFNYDYMESIINIEFTNYIENINNAITGPVIIEFPSLEDKMNGTCNKMKIMQETILKCKDNETVDFGGFMVASCYHVGSHETINETYEKIKSWIEKNGYNYENNSYERYVTDYWTTKNTDKFVTEVMIKISKGKK
ncbi:MerR family transcriptional regulator [Clostridium chauvoei]|uniref:MerR family transcriptional regulator n=2 Tax=Clostridium chauvoei TaxID=46867 RepID=A0ABD4RGY0_9CLOT|nr:GyrI-like domain-containing protein [Clostridium chauvoei]ATD55751.1 MerR family transcriptional regulator [Clostridium chauvoei]ATD56573.1 MerR family transcriptional regulator [Clostridium chauvoei]MBX7280296.1 MerR family transcriptional regulator [Clostridium chauvoei]MBX7282781.1 MerR family transcriptional regulator [Clostridium chauvoei]MBX7285187.1 MerR family transcriptional regulator [Clostridium chauvoei]